MKGAKGKVGGGREGVEQREKRMREGESDVNGGVQEKRAREMGRAKEQVRSGEVRERGRQTGSFGVERGKGRRLCGRYIRFWSSGRLDRVMVFPFSCQAIDIDVKITIEGLSSEFSYGWVHHFNPERLDYSKMSLTYLRGIYGKTEKAGCMRLTA